MPPPDHGAAAQRARRAQELGLEREVDDVGDPELAGAAGSAGSGMPGYFAMPIGVVLTIPSAPPTASRDVRRRRRRARRRSARPSSPASCSARARSVSTIVSAPTPSVSRACATAAPAPPAPNCTTRSRGASGSSRRKLSAKPDQSVLCPIAPPVLEHHRVDGAERARIGGQLVEERDDRLLAGMGDVEAGEAEALAPRSGARASASTPSPSAVEVDELVHVAQALLGALALVQARRARRLDAGADQAAEEGTCLGPGTLGCFAARKRPRLSIRPLRGSRSVHGPNASCKGADPVSP